MNISTWIYTRLNGILVGMDEYGNNYYRSKNKNRSGREKRWVLYKDEVEASLVPPEWHAWLHHTIEEPLTEKAVNQAHWQLNHKPNLTGTSRAYRPKGHLIDVEQKSSEHSNYKAWIPK